MTVKLSLLKSGEDVIADIQEMVIDERVVGYFFGNPCIVKVLAKNYDDSGNQSKTPCQLQLTPWMPLTNDEKIPVSPDLIRVPIRTTFGTCSLFFLATTNPRCASI